MQEQVFTLKPTLDFIELLKLLKIMQFAQTGGHAKILVEDGLVTVNGELELRKRKKLRDGDVVEINDNRVVVRAAVEDKGKASSAKKLVVKRAPVKPDDREV